MLILTPNSHKQILIQCKGCCVVLQGQYVTEIRMFCSVKLLTFKKYFTIFHHIHIEDLHEMHQSPSKAILKLEQLSFAFAF